MKLCVRLAVCAIAILGSSYGRRHQHRARTEARSEAQIEVCSKDLNGYPCDCSPRKGIIDCHDESLHTTHLKPVYDSGGQHMHVREVNLQNNHISAVFKDDIIPGHANTTEKLDLSQNIITYVEEGAFKDMKQLQKLDLSYNRISHVTKEIFEEDLAWNLRQLDLSHNDLKNLSDSPFENLSDLRELALDANHFNNIDRNSFKGLKHLVKLSLDNTGLHHIGEDWLSHMGKLETLSLRYNRILVMPQFTGLTSLTSLDISGNPITEMNSDVFRDMPTLEQLTMTQMPYLWAIEDCAFCGLAKLKELRAFNNPKLYVIDEYAFGLTPKFEEEVVVMDFEGCALQTLSEHSIPWRQVGSLKLDNNPWTCDCLLRWMRHPNIQLRLQDPPKCASPSNVANHSISLLSESELQCARHSKIQRMGRVFFVLTLFVLVSAGLFLLWFMWLGRGRSSLRNLLHKPHLPRYAYRNLAMAAAEDTDDLVLKERHRPPSPVHV